MFCMRLHQISLHFVVYNILTKYVSNHSFLARFFWFMLYILLAGCGFVHCLIWKRKLILEYLNWKSQIELYLFFFLFSSASSCVRELCGILYFTTSFRRNSHPIAKLLFWGRTDFSCALWYFQWLCSSV